MRHFIKIVLVLYALLGNTNLHAQEGIDELKKINSTMSGLRNLSVDISYNVYKNYYATKAVEETKATVKRAGENMLNTFGNQTILKNAKYLVYVDADEKRIIVDNAHKSKVKNQPAGFTNFYQQLDSILKNANEVRANKLNESNKKLFISFDKVKGYMDCSRIEIIYNPKSYVMSKMIFYYNQEMSLQDDGKGSKERPRLEICFDKMDTGEISNETFSESIFFQKSSKSLKPSLNYKNYELVDQRLKK
ncbi:MAG: hypothetical protein J7604_18095 [Sporocytophaga sp.]|uniref:hypothetical protein n=1 Tax=Sporocytophaga sp. TaxID=2231183 RepID=UPI001B2D0435|nr:hypothetical protein [Sporocytophaga sp.]MBO9702126.1 hypothetical protein [Sporocytophaga sp.]